MPRLQIGRVKDEHNRTERHAQTYSSPSKTPPPPHFTAATLKDSIIQMFARDVWAEDVFEMVIGAFRVMDAAH